RFDFRTCRTESAIGGIKDGTIDLAIVRSDAVDETLNIAATCSMNYKLMVPRSLLPGKSAAGFQMIKELPFALLNGDGTLMRRVQQLLAQNGVNVVTRAEAE